MIKRGSKTPHKVFWGLLIISLVLIQITFISDPVLGRNETKLIPSDGEIGDNIGYSVALTADGSFALVGAPGHDTYGDKSGAVYMFTRDGAVWGTTEDWSKGAPDGMTDDQYGFSVALGDIGKYAVIGAPYHDHLLIDGPTGGSSGTAYILWNNPETPGSSWLECSELYGYSEIGDLFGWSVALSGDESTALVGAPGANLIGIKSGAAYLFTEQVVTTWPLAMSLWPEDPVQNGLFGHSVALSGDGSTVLVGAPGEDAAYIFAPDPNGGWAQQTKLIPSDGTTSAFGWSVALSTDGSTALVGAPSNNGDSGAVFVYSFIESEGDWVEIQKLVSSDCGNSDQFGWSVALNEYGNISLIGAPFHDDAGAVYWFKFNGLYWSQHIKNTALDKMAGDQFGSSVALNGNGTIALVGAPNQNGTYVVAWQSDVIPPIVEITSPSNLVYGQDGVILSYTVSEGLTTVYIDGVANITAIPSGSVITGLSDGEHEITVSAEDPAGNIGEDMVVFTIDTTPPSVHIISPTPKTYTQDSVILSYTVSEGLTTVYIDGVVNITAIPSGSVITGLSDGEHEITITAEDPVGNIGEDMVVFTIDTTPPSVHIISPTPKIYNQDSVILSYTLSDGTVTIYLDDIANTSALVSGSVLSDLSEGSHNLTLVAMDALGNIGYTEVIFSVDTIAPLVIIDSPFVTTYTTSEISISLLGEAMQYWYSILGVDPENLTWTSETHRLLVDGVYTVHAYGSDSAGNVGQVSVTFSIDTIAPTITHLSEVTYEEGTNTFLISWSPYDENPSHYSVMQNDQVVVEEDWHGETIPFDVGGLARGIHFFVCNVYDEFGHNISDTVVVIVIDSTSPYIDQPIDLTIEEGTLGRTITWTATDTNPFCYFIKRNDLVVDGGDVWHGETISTNLDGLEIGVYTYTCVVYDTEGNQANDSVMVTVIDTTVPFIDHPNNLIYVEGITANNITWYPSDNHPSSYTITMNGTQVEAGSWNGNSITISFEDLEPGDYIFICTVFDEAGNSVNDSVLVQVPQYTARGSSWSVFSYSLIAVCLIVLLRRVKKNP